MSSAESKVSVPSGQTIAGIFGQAGEASGADPAVAGSNGVGVIPGANKMDGLMDAHVSDALDKGGVFSVLFWVERSAGLKVTACR